MTEQTEEQELTNERIAELMLLDLPQYRGIIVSLTAYALDRATFTKNVVLESLTRKKPEQEVVTPEV